MSFTTYAICDPERPHVTLFSGTLEAVAEALAAEPDGAALAVYASDAGFSRSLNAEERRQLAVGREAG